MYLSALQRSILKKCLKNKRLENLPIDSDAIVKEILSNKQKNQKIDIINSSITDLLEIKNQKKTDFETITEYGYIELDSNAHAHIYFYEPLIDFFKIIPKEKYINDEMYIYNNKSENRKKFEIIKRKFIRKDGNHKRGIIRGECKFFKKSKASLSRSFSNLIKKELLRKISIINLDNKEIGIGFNITDLGINVIKK
ncbi:MAG: hypothetical protein CBE50_000745 [Flammeovirgaceae bacterium TMED290]|nr:MAG: hypothetical protein CBE50_000745 [Flammeovirgaceae bacterium TMED290]